jgi:Ca2+/Na+ antiporter
MARCAWMVELCIAGLHYDPNVPVSFGYLFTALVSSGIAVMLSDFKITKAWGVCLVGLYLAAMATSILVESDVIQL